MNIRSLTRGDGAVMGAALLLLIASFLGFYSVDCEGVPQSICEKVEAPIAWELNKLPIVLPTVFLMGIIGAALVVLGRLLPAGRKFGELSLPQWGTALSVVSVWSALWSLLATPGNNSPGVGAILAFIATLVLAGVALFAAKVPALAGPLVPESRPKPAAAAPYGQAYGQPGQPGQPGPYGQQPQGGYGYPAGATQAQPQQGQQHAQPGPAGAGAPEAFQPFWFAVPVARPLFGEDGSPQPVAELTPGTWYLAVEQRGQALVAQTQDGRRGLLQDTTGIQRG